MPDSHFPARGAEWPETSLIWGHRGGCGASSESHSPLDGSLIQSIQLLSDCEQQQLLQAPTLNAPLNAEVLGRFTESLHRQMSIIRPLRIEACRWETGF